jgi:hypothetical protein
VLNYLSTGAILPLTLTFPTAQSERLMEGSCMPAGPHVSQAIQRVSIKIGTSDFVTQGYNGRYRAVSYGSTITPNMHEVQMELCENVQARCNCIEYNM